MGFTDSTTQGAPVRCFTAGRMRQLEISLRASARLCDDNDTVARLGDLAIHVRRRLYKHMDHCPVCLSQAKPC
jgi:hypothetical protein